MASALILLEEYATMLGCLDGREAREVSSVLLEIVVSSSPEVTFRAGEFRPSLRSRRKDCSYIDAWGGAAACQLEVPFLTGDTAFRRVENDESVR